MWLNPKYSKTMGVHVAKSRIGKRSTTKAEMLVHDKLNIKIFSKKIKK